jgi:hypothetical protein
VSAARNNDFLCQMCWQVLCIQPWPAEDSAHGSNAALQAGAAAARRAPAVDAPSPFAAAAAAYPQKRRSLPQRRTASMANFGTAGGGPPAGAMAVPAAGRPGHWQLPASMPEPHVILAGSAEDSRWNPLSAAVGGSAPGGRGPSLAGPPTFSPAELRHMMDEESLALFEQQSHLLDAESREALQRQRQYLQWQSSLEEPGPMQSVLERQDSAGSGCNQHQAAGGRADGGADGGAAAAAGGQAGSGGRDHESAGANGSVHGMSRVLEEARRQLGAAVQERDAMAARLAQAEVERDALRQEATCKMCCRVSLACALAAASPPVGAAACPPRRAPLPRRPAANAAPLPLPSPQAPRNCVILPCLHFMSCDDCFKKHATASPTCPACSTPLTGFQTLLMLR